ncbi:response regulator [Candidatus Leptofilum sp.]|uniref:response regulator n=1 Tax=Candidatus Leptofilum sp. TaxID=3241576 RepID=UPI003B5909B0
MKVPQALIVEDVTDLAVIFAQAIAAAGYEVTTLADGLLAQTYLNETVPDLILLDIHLPHLRGDKLFQHLHRDPQFNQTKIIIVTADSHRGEELREEVDLVLLKPISYLQLRDLTSRLATVQKSPG